MSSLSPTPSLADPDAEDGVALSDADLTAFGAHLRACRRAAGMTQEDLAFASNLHWTYISQIERGMRNLTYKSILMLAHGLDTTPGRLMPDAL
ncbi:MAG: helix-turn-helix transcriptional regulator [Patulibacter sp.]